MFSSHESRQNSTVIVGDRTASKKKPRQNNTKPLTIDYGAKKPLPGWVSEIINTSLAIEAEDAKSAGHLGFMARALVIATMPYKDPKADVFKRVNGDFKLRIVAGYEGGVPFGIYPRLLMSWVATEAVRKQSPVIELGDSLRVFLRDVLELRSNGGGSRGTSTRVNDQMKRLFGALVTAQYSGPNKNEGFVLRNVMIADELEMAEDIDLDDDAIEVNADSLLWMPQRSTEAGKWKSQVRLNNKFFNECINNPVPIDLRAYKVLRGSPLAMDVYTWLTYRMSCMQRRSRPIRWESLMGQFGSNFGSDIDQAVRDFRKAFFKALKLVNIVYPQAKIEVHEHGLVLLPSPPHIPFKTQPTLF